MLLPDALRRGFDIVCGLECFELLGHFGSARPFLFVLLMGRAGKPGLELVTQGGQFKQVGIKSKRLTELCLVVAQLGLGNGDVLPHTVAFGAVGAGQAFQGVAA
jgi:hypothetical protein